MPKTYFFEKYPSGEIFACEAIEADQVHRDGNRKVQLIGVSDGKEYARIMKEWKPRVASTDEEELIAQQELAEIQKKAFNAELEIARHHIEEIPDLSVFGESEAVRLVKK